MPNVCARPQRNQFMECVKLIAAILVVFLHVPFPDAIQGIIHPLANFAVPLFFAISGYFNYGADHPTLIRRLKHLLKLYLVGIITAVVYGVITVECTGGSSIAFLRSYMPDLEEMVRWILLHKDPRMGQLWYLTAACMCYLFLSLYVRFFGDKPVDYRPLYVISTSLFAVYFSLGNLAPVLGHEVDYLIYRNGYFLGLPMFTLGIFLHAHQSQIIENFALTTRKLVLLILASAAFVIVQFRTVGLGQTSPATILEVIALMLLMVANPIVSKKSGFFSSCIAKFGTWSTFIYILHILVFSFYQDFCQSALSAALPNGEVYLRPFAVAGLSLAAAMVFERCGWLLRRRRS